MKFAKRLLMVAGAVAIAGVLSVAFVPRAVHAVVSTLVTVVNNVPIVNSTSASGPQGIITEETDGASRQPVQAPCNVYGPPPFGGVQFGCTAMYSVPAGKRLVIEYADAWCESPKNVFNAEVITGIAGVPIPYNLTVVNEGLDELGTPFFAVAQPLRAYADPSTNVDMLFASTDTTGSTHCVGGFSGYLEPSNVQ